jgi:hypothetical protein
MDPISASRMITDEYAAKILIATYRRPKNAIELSQKLGIPIAACYRRIKALEKARLLTCTERILTQKGKRISVYISELKNAYIFMENGQLRVRFDMKNGLTQDFGGVWDPMVEAASPPEEPLVSR